LLAGALGADGFTMDELPAQLWALLVAGRTIKRDLPASSEFGRGHGLRLVISKTRFQPESKPILAHADWKPIAQNTSFVVNGSKATNTMKAISLRKDFMASIWVAFIRNLHELSEKTFSITSLQKLKSLVVLRDLLQESILFLV
jgi:hypothetical protein